MEENRPSRALLEYLTLHLRHAVSNGEYITVDLLERTLQAYVPPSDTAVNK
jgi:hypothetical protein